MNLPLDFIFGIPETSHIVYDEETYPNIFTCHFRDVTTDREWMFEISDWKNELDLLVRFIDYLRAADITGVGFNNLHFDYPVLHFIYQNRRAVLSSYDIYNKAMSIINAPYTNRFAHVIWERDQIFKQVDLYKVHHFDNKAKATSLKVIEFNMRSHHVEDLPFPPGTILTAEQAVILRMYNRHDTAETKEFFKKSVSQIQMREALTQRFGEDMMNCSDVKIGEKILLNSLEKAGVQCHTYVDNKRVKLQTKRDYIDLSEVIFPYVKFERIEFDGIRRDLASKVITETKGVFKDLVAVVEGMEYKFGTGGLHASLDAQIVKSDETYQLVDVDVASFYPNLGIKNRLYPQHLGEQFCVAYDEVYHTRKQYPKGKPENEAYKLALNGSYGNSNNEYSVLYDPFYTMSITINGQLLLCMLIEQLVKIPGLKMVQANTDGVTFLCPRIYLDHSRAVCRWWEQVTQLELEEALYDAMYIRDVNNYIAVKEGGKIKRIGAYAYETALENPGTRELPWHKDWSFRIIAKAAEANLVHGVPLREFIENHADVYDFLGRTKVPRSAMLMHGDKQVENIVRYYVSTEGEKLEKVMKPAGPIGAYKRANGLTDQYYNSVIDELIENETRSYPVDGSALSYEEMRARLPWDERINTKNKSVYEERRIGIHTGWRVRVVNNLSNEEFFRSNYHPADLNYDYYIEQAKKLVHLMKHDNEEETQYGGEGE